MIKTNQGANAGQIKAARIKGSTSSPSSQSNSLGGTVERIPWLGCGWSGVIGGECNSAVCGTMRYVVRSSGWIRRLSVLSLST
jgi:hypothetical protein